MRISGLEFIYCEVKRKIADIMFIYNLLKDKIFYLKLLFIFEFNTSNQSLKKSNLFHFLYYKNNLSSISFFLRTLKLK